MGSFLSTNRDPADPPEIKQPQLSTLPVEPALQVASHLSRKVINNLRNVNKRWDHVLLECFNRLDLQANVPSREVLLQASRNERRSCHFRKNCICSALAFAQFVQQLEFRDLDSDDLYAHKAASPMGRVDTTTCLTGFENLKSLDLHLGIPVSHQHQNVESLFTERKVYVDFCNMINALVPRLDYLSLSNGIGPDRIPIDAILRRIKLKGIPHVRLGCLWGLRTELIDQLEDCRETLRGLELEIYHPAPGKDKKLWRARLDDLREILRLEYLDTQSYPVSKSELLSHIPSWDDRKWGLDSSKP
ncbi:hypothetical protein KCU83_g6981, partial [Aureobasidium melanogenum]